MYKERERATKLNVLPECEHASGPRMTDGGRRRPTTSGDDGRRMFFRFLEITGNHQTCAFSAPWQETFADARDGEGGEIGTNICSIHHPIQVAYWFQNDLSMAFNLKKTS